MRKKYKKRTSKNHVKIKHEKIRDFLLQYILTHSKLPSRNESHGFSRQRLSYHISKLKKKSIVERVGYAVWRVTEIGQNLLRGSRESSKNIEIWGAGYKFLLDKLIDFKYLNIIRLKNGLEIEQGWLNGCWIKYSVGKKSRSIIIKSPVERSDDVFEAWTSAMNKVQECRKFIEEKYLVKLIPIERTEPDFIIKTQEGKKLAQQILSKYGRIRTDHVDIDISKSGTFDNPDFEVHTLEDAVNTIDNFAIESKADQILNAMVKWNKNFELHYSVLNQTKNAMRNNNKIMEEIRDAVNKLSRRLSKPKITKRILHKGRISKPKRRTARKLPGMVDESKIIDIILRRLNG